MPQRVQDQGQSAEEQINTSHAARSGGRRREVEADVISGLLGPQGRARSGDEADGRCAASWRLRSPPAAPTVQQTHEPVHHAVHQPPQHPVHQPPQHSAHQPPPHAVHQPPQHSAHQPPQQQGISSRSIRRINRRRIQRINRRSIQCISRCCGTRIGRRLPAANATPEQPLANFWPKLERGRCHVA